MVERIKGKEPAVKAMLKSGELPEQAKSTEKIIKEIREKQIWKEKINE